MVYKNEWSTDMTNQIDALFHSTEPLVPVTFSESILGMDVQTLADKGETLISIDAP